MNNARARVRACPGVVLFEDRDGARGFSSAGARVRGEVEVEFDGEIATGRGLGFGLGTELGRGLGFGPGIDGRGSPVGVESDAVLAEESEASSGDAASDGDAVVAVVFLVENGGVAFEVGENLAVGESDVEEGFDGGFIELGADGAFELVESVAAGGADGDGVGVSGEEDVEEGSVADAIDLVEDEDDGLLGEFEFGEHGLDGGDLLLGLGAGCVDDVEEDVGAAGLLECGLEGCDEGVGEVADESDGVGEEGLAAAAEGPAPGSGVERGEELVGDVDGGAGEGVHEGGLAGVGVADEGDGGGLVARGDLAFLAGLDAGELFLEVADAVGDEPPVLLELLFAGSAHADATLVPGEVGPHALEAGHGVLELGEFDLELGLVGAGAGGEDVEDDLGAVDDLDLEGLFEVAGLGGSEIVVEEGEVGLVGLDELAELVDLAGADIRCDVDLLTLLEK